MNGSNVILKFFEMLFTHLKLSMYRLKISLFSLYLVAIAFNYFIKIGKKDGHWFVEIDPSNIPTATFIAIGIVIFFLILMDIMYNVKRSKNLMNIIKDENLPIELRQAALDHLSKIK